MSGFFCGAVFGGLMWGAPTANARWGILAATAALFLVAWWNP
jgi:hypothetical protein